MHYYPFHIGDYRAHTQYLTPIEHMCYRFLLDEYYLHEKPLSLNVERLSKILLLSDYKDVVQNILEEFFYKTEDGWRNKRADAEIEKYNNKIKIASKAGKKSGEKRKKQQVDKSTGEVL